MIEFRAESINNLSPEELEKIFQQAAPSFRIDAGYDPVPMRDRQRNIQSYIVRGEMDAEQIAILKQHDSVLGVFMDSPISPF